MGFQVSPGILVKEIDLTTVVPAVSTTEGAFAGVFSWGPVEDVELITSGDELVFRYGKPTSNNFETFFTASNFLDYGNKLYVSRAANNAFTALAGPSVSSSAITVKNRVDYDTQNSTVSNSGGNYYLAKYPGLLGSSLKISVCDSANAYYNVLTVTGNNTLSLSATVGSNTANLVIVNADSDVSIANTQANNVLASLSTGDIIQIGNTTINFQALRLNTKSTTTAINSSAVYATLTFDTLFTLSSNISVTSVTRYWEYSTVVDSAPGTSAYVQGNGGAGDEMHIVVVDEDGKFSGVRGTVLEVFPAISRATDAKAEQGGSLYYKNVINDQSKYVWWASDRAGAESNTAANMTAMSNTRPLTLSFVGGTDGDAESTISIAKLAAAYDKFASAENIDISLVLTGKSRGGAYGEQLGNYLIDNIAEKRKDCVVFVSPDLGDVVNTISPVENVVEFRNACRSTSYGFLDNGYKYQYDKYNDLYRWVPLNGDMAGLCVRTDDQRDAWWSPAGFNRGFIKNFVKLAYNPNKGQRDVLYKAGINPVVTFPGEGTILYGDKTMQAKPSAFDRINVRRLFIVLEKAISTAAKYTLFEFNDAFTRAQFRNLVEPFLRDVMGRRGIYDFKVICDETNNTPEVIDRNEFVGSIFIKPARSINYITLNFIATRTGVEFTEVVGF